MAQGLTGFAGGRPEPQPVVRLFSFLVDKATVAVRVRRGDDERRRFRRRLRSRDRRAAAARAASAEPLANEAPTVRVPLIAHRPRPQRRQGRHRQHRRASRAMRRVRARRFAQRLTAAAVGALFRALCARAGRALRLARLARLQLSAARALGGGGVASLRHDPQGKALAQVLLDMPVAVPAAWLGAGGPLAGWTREPPCERRMRPSCPVPKVLIANRGEIACRIERTLRELGHRLGRDPSRRSRRARRMCAQADEAVEIFGDTPVAAHLDAGADHRGGAEIRRRRHPSRLRLPVGERRASPRR